MVKKSYTKEQAEALREAEYAALDSRAVTDAARSLVDELCRLCIAEEMRGSRTNRRKKTAPGFKRALEGFLGDILRAQAHKKSNGHVYRSLSQKAFTGKAVSYRTFKSINDLLIKLRLVAIAAPGFQDLTDFGSGKVAVRAFATRFRATAKLLKAAEEHGVHLPEVRQHFIPELPAHPLQLRTASTRNHYGDKVQGSIMKFKQTAQTEKLETQVKELNAFIAEFDIRGGAHRGFIRGFNNGDQKGFNWNKGGRLYSVGDDSYQQLSQQERLQMTIDGEPICEIDIRASYLTLLHAAYHEPFDPSKDPYELPRVPRNVVKRWFLATFGSNRHVDRWPKKALQEHREETGENLSKLYPVKMIREKAIEAFPILGSWGKPVGGREIGWADLMFRESEAIVLAMHDLMVTHGVPSLPVHDSLIVPESKAKIAMKAIDGGYFLVSEADPKLVVRRA